MRPCLLKRARVSVAGYGVRCPPSPLNAYRKRQRVPALVCRSAPYWILLALRPHGRGLGESAETSVCSPGGYGSAALMLLSACAAMVSVGLMASAPGMAEPSTT